MSSAQSGQGSTSRQVSGAWEKVARTGYAVSGLIHLLLGFTIAQIGLGSGGEADQTAALGQIGGSALGAAVLWIAVVAFVGLGAWQVADALSSRNESSDRAKAAGKAVMYLSLAFTSSTIAMGTGGDTQSGSGDSQAQGFAAGLMAAPAGRILVGAVGVGILAGGVYHVIKGARKKFLEDLQATPGGELGRGVRILGMVGYIAKGVALAVVGVLFVTAAATADPEQAQGIDGAIESLLGAPGGPVLVVLVGIGFAAFGVYSFARARYAKM